MTAPGETSALPDGTARSLGMLTDALRAEHQRCGHPLTTTPETSAGDPLAAPATEPHRHSFPCQPPAGSITDPGPCECGTTYEMATASALLAAAARRVEAAGGDPAEILAGRRDREAATMPKDTGP